MSTQQNMDWSAQSMDSLQGEFQRATGYTAAKKEGRLISRRSNNMAKVQQQAAIFASSRMSNRKAASFNPDNF